VAAIGLVLGDEGERLRAQLRARVAAVLAGMAALGLRARADAGVLVVVVGDDRRVMACTAQLLERGVFVQGIRPPTVPDGTARLRIAVSAAHSEDDVSRLVDGLGALVREGLIPREDS
jgi:8-amino-7-oxononanoate synthase